MEQRIVKTSMLEVKSDSQSSKSFNWIRWFLNEALMEENMQVTTEEKAWNSQQIKY